MGLPRGPSWPYPWAQPVDVNILIVADGDRVSFFPGTDFSLSTVIDTLRHTAWWVRFNVTTAHRGTDHYGTPDIPAFAFNKPGVDLSAYDEIWLFGDDGPDLTADENARIAKFMDNGGGVFATGDHDELGAGMGAGLLRAGLMRKWKIGGPLGNPPPVLGATRHDTIVPGPDHHYDFYDQSDDRPQTISIRPRYGWSPFPWIQQTFPHALLCGSKGAITVLPDHMHEGECALPSSYAGNTTFGAFYSTTTWPGTVRPSIVADATVTAHIDDNYGMVNGTTFPVIAEYDGHAASVGRIATDATWHHWFDVNLIGDIGPYTAGGGVLPEPVDAHGFNASAQGKAYLSQIKEYHRNVAMWLAPKAKIAAMFAKAVAGLPYVAPLNEYSGKESILLLGTAARDAIGRAASQCVVSEWITGNLPQTLQPLFDPTIVERPIGGDPAPMRGLYLYREFALGGVVREIFALRAQRSLLNADEKQLHEAVTRGLRFGLAELVAYERRAAKHTGLLTDALAQFAFVDDRALAKV
jgi:hypothetical protein